MGAFVVLGGLGVAALALLICWDWSQIRRRKDDAKRNKHNHRVRALYVTVGALWYPHELADGRVRWYRVDHDPVEL